MTSVSIVTCSICYKPVSSVVHAPTTNNCFDNDVCSSAHFPTKFDLNLLKHHDWQLRLTYDWSSIAQAGPRYPSSIPRLLYVVNLKSKKQTRSKTLKDILSLIDSQGSICEFCSFMNGGIYSIKHTNTHTHTTKGVCYISVGQVRTGSHLFHG